VKVIASINHTSPREYVTKSEDQVMPHSSPRPEQLKLVRNNENYFYISIALSAVFLCLLAGAAFLWWCVLRPRTYTLRRSGPVHSGAETHPLSINTI